MPETPPVNPSVAHPTWTTGHTLVLPQGEISYTASAGWHTLVDGKEIPSAKLFHVAYYLPGSEAAHRPLTFVFNGGPGAASAYLHMGALGPQRVEFGAEGSLPRPPVRLVDNLETWLPFTDLVFIDPIGTGFSRSIVSESDSRPPEKSGDKPQPKETDPPKETEFWEVERDLTALGEFIQGYLSKHKRWRSPIFIAGESYGGFRVAKLVRSLQQGFGIGLSGAILISPALEFSMLYGNDYNLTSWVSLIPSFTAAALHHGRIRKAKDLATQLQIAEEFARQTLIPLLALGDAAKPKQQQQIYEQLSALIGLPPSVVERHSGRIDISTFSRELLRQQRRIVGLYDASVTAIDPFPGRTSYEGADPTLDGLDRLFMGAINSHLRDTLGVETDLAYRLLNLETFKAWKFDSKSEFKQGYLGSVDDLRVGMALNPYLKVYINHGVYDLVTPYFASNHLVDLMKLDPGIRSNLHLKHYRGGHMFYTWQESRQQWFEDMQSFYQQCLLS